MPSVAELLAEDEAPKKRQSLAALLDDAAPAKEAPAPAAGKKNLPWHSRASTGFNDVLHGAGQLMQNLVPDSVMNVARTAAASVAGAVPGVPNAVVEDIARPVSEEQFNASEQKRESEYQQERADAGQEGVDWWRVGGMAANPVSWMGAGGKANSVLQAVKSGAKIGTFQALMQPVTDRGNFLYSKGLQSLVGAAGGGTLGAAVHAIAAPIGAVVQKLSGGGAAAAKAASTETDQVLRAAGVEPQSMDPRLYSSIQREVAEAIDSGTSIDPRVITNRADAAALPVPMDMTRGQATRDPMQFSWEMNNAKLRGAGEPLTNMLANQNRQLIENLNVMGARNAPSQFDVSKQVIGHIKQVDDAARASIDTAYQKVRDSAGRPALMDHITFVDQANNGLDHGQLGPFLPEAIRGQLNDIAAGKLPLTVNVAQQLDKVWSAAQRGTQDGSAKLAIGQLRDALNAAPVSDSLGAESMAAYKAARAMARDRFAMIESIPAYKAVDDGVEPDKFFQRYVTGANASDISGLTKLVGPDNTKLLQQTAVANLKSTALGRASDENGVFSQSAFNRVMQDPQAAPRLAALFESSPETLSQLYRLGRVSENVVAFPKMHSVNTSNTTPTAANLARDVIKEQGEGLLSRMFPVVGGLRKVASDYKDAKAVSAAVSEAVNPGVTTAPVVKRLPSSGRLSDLAGRAAGAGGASYTTKKRDEERQ